MCLIYLSFLWQTLFKNLNTLLEINLWSRCWFFRHQILKWEFCQTAFSLRFLDCHINLLKNPLGWGNSWSQGEFQITLLYSLLCSTALGRVNSMHDNFYVFRGKGATHEYYHHGSKQHPSPKSSYSCCCSRNATAADKRNELSEIISIDEFCGLKSCAILLAVYPPRGRCVRFQMFLSEKNLSMNFMRPKREFLTFDPDEKRNQYFTLVDSNRALLSWL